MATYECYELVATIKVGFNNDNVEDIIQLLAFHGVLCPNDKFKAAVVGDNIAVICMYGHSEVN